MAQRQAADEVEPRRKHGARSMTDTLTLSSVLQVRNRTYHRLPGLRLRTPAEARRFVREVGFCLFWPTRGLEAPTLLHAIAGRAVALGAGYDHPAIGRSWNWKDEALDKRWWYYGRLLHGRATLVSLDLLPAFYALSENYGDPDEYLQQYEDGRLSSEARSVYEALLRLGPLDTVRLRKEARLAGESAKARFQRAVSELQEGLKILPTGVAEAGAWDYAFTYDLVTRWLPELDQQARAWTTADARRAILLRHLDNLAAATEPEVRKVLGWPVPVLRRTVARLLESGEIEKVAVFEGRESHEMMATRSSARRMRRARRGGRSVPARRRR